MKKIKELLKRLETALLKMLWVFAKLTTLRNYLTKILAAIELFHLRNDVHSRIDSWETDKAANRIIVSLIMDNVLKYIGDEMSASHKTESNHLSFRVRALLNLEVATQLVSQLSNIIGIQPLKSPVGLIYLMRYKFGDAENELGTGKKMTLEIISQAVEAKSRRLTAGWTLEAMQDMRCMHKLDIESEISKLTANEIASEYVSEVLSDLLSLAQEIDISELKLVSTFDAEPVDSTKRLVIEINKAASNIAFRTRRGAGNVMVVPVHVVSMLQALPEGWFETATPATFESGSLLYAGKLNGQYKVYTSLSLTDKVLVGYKGHSSEVDTGYILSPYIPALYSGTISNSLTYQPMGTFMTRYGKDINGDREAAQEYYRVLKLDVVESDSVPDDLESDNA